MMTLNYYSPAYMDVDVCLSFMILILTVLNKLHLYGDVIFDHSVLISVYSTFNANPHICVPILLNL